MICLKRCACYATLIGMASVTAAYADGVTAINSAVVTTHAFNDVPTSTPIVFNSYPSFILTAEENVSAPTGFANRDTWQFSANGTTPFQIGPKDYFLASMTLTLTGTPITPRKEAGWLFSTGSNGDIQFILDTDGHEVVQFGGISFYSFTGSSVIPPYQSGQAITLGIKYFQDPSTGANALQFFANTNASPIFDFTPSVGSGALDIGEGSTLGGYFQIVNDPTNPSNSGSALFNQISIVPAPEPTEIALLGAGVLSSLIIFRRRNR
jgi:hypothetical protein